MATLLYVFGLQVRKLNIKNHLIILDRDSNFSWRIFILNITVAQNFAFNS